VTQPLLELPELIDSHAHFDRAATAEGLEAARQQLARARSQGVTQVVAIGGGRGLEGNLDVLALARAVPGVYPTIGVHPHDVAAVPAGFCAEVERMAAHPQVVAVGEIGLDYHYDHSPRELQRQSFAAQLEVALRLGKPVVIHTREADDDTAALLKESGIARVGGVLHCFTSGAPLAKAALELGFDISFSGIVTFKNAEDIRQVARTVPLDRLLIETDTPYLAPVPHRGRPNEPSHVRLVCEALARAIGQSPERVAEATTANARRRFGLDQARLEI
jgi:TatD DNase family protein